MDLPARLSHTLPLSRGTPAPSTHAAAFRRRSTCEQHEPRDRVRGTRVSLAAARQRFPDWTKTPCWSSSPASSSHSATPDCASTCPCWWSTTCCAYSAPPTVGPHSERATRRWSFAACRGVRPSPEELRPLLLGQHSSRDLTRAFLPRRRLGDDHLRHPVGLFERDGALIELDGRSSAERTCRRESPPTSRRGPT